MVLRNYHFPSLVLFTCIVTGLSSLKAQAPRRPFPQHVVYGPGIIRPGHISQQEMDDSVRAFYQVWKKHYIRVGCGEEQNYVWFEGPDKQKQSVSEGQGYGMLIVALMAGADPSARKVYDGLFRYYRAHPSKADPHLMSWAQKKNCRDVDGTSATDGDLDIAYSLLLADAQWGSNGPIHYLEEARATIAAIQKEEINQRTFSILLSNSVEHDSRDYFDTRSSDFMPAHFRAFRAVSGDPRWDKVIDNTYRLFAFMQQSYSPEAGLVPDFINHISISEEPAGLGSSNPEPPARQTASPGNVHAVPARPRYLESRYDGMYNYNACRVPWRIATDLILNGDQRAAAILEKINRWIRGTTQDNPDNISAGYSLGGVDLKNRDFEALCFITSFAVSAMANRQNQQWLNKLWDYIVRFRSAQFDYYDNSIKMINMIILSGNYWKP